jgi:hypothetical protein
VDVTDYLVRERYAAGDKVFGSGLSAGGLKGLEETAQEYSFILDCLGRRR